MPYAFFPRTLRAHRRSCTRYSEVRVKVSSLISSSSIARGVVAAALALALSAVGASAPVAASAEEAVVPQTPGASLEVTSVAPFSAPATFTVTLTPTATPEPTATAPVVKKKKLTIRQLVAKVGRSQGLNKAQVDALLWLCKRESNFHPNSHSRSECHGLFQLSKGMAHGKPWRNPTWNTKRAIKYMRGRYGGVLQAKRFWISHHWY